MSLPTPAPPPHGIQVYDHGDRQDCVIERSPGRDLVRIGLVLAALVAIMVGSVHAQWVVGGLIMAGIAYARWHGLGRATPAVSKVPGLVLTLTARQVQVRQRGGPLRHLDQEELRSCHVRKRLGVYELYLATPHEDLVVGRGQDPSHLYWLERQVLGRVGLLAPQALEQDTPRWIPVPPIQQVAITTELDRVRVAMAAPGTTRKLVPPLVIAGLALGLLGWFFLFTPMLFILAVLPLIFAATLRRTLSLDLTPQALVLRERLGPLTLRTVKSPLEGLRAVVLREQRLDLDTGRQVARVGQGLTPEALGWLKGVLDRARERRRQALGGGDEGQARPPEALLSLRERP